MLGKFRQNNKYVPDLIKYFTEQINEKALKNTGLLDNWHILIARRKSCIVQIKRTKAFFAESSKCTPFPADK